MPKLHIFLSIYYVYLLELNFFLMIVAFVLNRKYVREIFTAIGRKYTLILILIALFGVCATAFVAPRIHRIYYDEDIYNNIGQSIAACKRAVVCNEAYYENNELIIVGREYNKQPIGFPFLTSIAFRLFDTNDSLVFILNNFLYGFAAIVVFLICYLLFKDVFTASCACLFYVLIPVNLQWFNTCAAEPSTTFFAGLAILASLIYIRNKKPVNLFFLITALAFSFNFRPESFLIFFVVGLLFLLKDIGILMRKEFYIYAALLLILSSGIIIHTHAMRGQSWGATGSKFDLDYFYNNFKTNSLFYLDNKSFPLMFSILAIAGLLFYKNRECFREKIVLLGWFTAFWGIFLFFYAGSYEFGQDVRFSLLSYVPFSIFGGLGASFIKNLLENKVKSFTLILILLVMFNFTWFLPFIRAEGDEAWEARTGRKYAVEFAKLLPDNSIIFTHTPNIFLLNKRSAIQSSSETYNPGIIKQHLERFKGGVYVDFNYWSNVEDPEQRGLTENILNRYNYQMIKEYHWRNYKYGLYKITGQKDAVEK
ncbi:MAG: glycosyltransferase family 39 protein [Sedimentisphaerales bacterium]|nr:glycosyltransferase family 39 protein [Sedimentisphaerales bacterium]